MSSYASFYINGQELLHWRNGLSSLVTSLFTKNDIIRGRGIDGLKLIKKYNLSYYNDYTEDHVDWEITLVVIDVATLKQRLSIYGYNAQLFNKFLDAYIEELNVLSNSFSDDKMKRYYENEIKQVNDLRAGKISLKNRRPYIFFENYAEQRVAIWGMVHHEDVKEDDIVVLDISDLVEGGWLDDELENTDSDFLIPQDEFIPEIPIILTEGVTDIKTLKKALHVIYPKLESNVRFLDTSFGPETNAAAIVKMIKSFAAAGINNRILAILDNDAAASEAMASLPRNLPNNIKVIQYPELDLMTSYPTIGPQGEINMNINGLAGSIEMYMGKDILTGNDGNLELVQWGGYMNRVKKYQGSLINKDAVGSRFKGKDAADVNKWQDLRYLWDYIIDNLSTL
ncbi:MAG: hypothetical protein LP071_03615 [Candidatus Nanogingivalaceae bacterium]|nr:hypothetical protein [Candidatus Nanogingivalaceae bacterium]